MNKLFPHKEYRKIIVAVIESVIATALFLGACAIAGKIIELALMVAGL